MSEQPFESAEPASTPPGVPPSGPPPGPPFDQPPPKAEKPRWRQVLIMFFGGAVLAIGGCAMFVFALNDGASEGRGLFGAAIFVVGALLALVGGITGLVYLITAIFRSGKR
jgi:hypothetical protein